MTLRFQDTQLGRVERDIENQVDDQPYEDRFMGTASGRYWNLKNPSSKDVRFRDIAVALSKQCRYNGHFPGDTFYSVAEHSVFGAQFLHQQGHPAAPYFLLHDAHEAYLGDLPTPVKNVMSTEARAEWNTRVFEHDVAIYKAAGMKHPMPAAIADKVHEIDAAMYVAETYRFRHPDLWNEVFDKVPIQVQLQGWSHTRAFEEFMRMFELFGITEDRPEISI